MESRYYTTSDPEQVWNALTVPLAPEHQELADRILALLDAAGIADDPDVVIVVSRPRRQVCTMSLFRDMREAGEAHRTALMAAHIVDHFTSGKVGGLNN